MIGYPIKYLVKSNQFYKNPATILNTIIIAMTTDNALTIGLYCSSDSL